MGRGPTKISGIPHIIILTRTVAIHQSQNSQAINYHKHTPSRRLQSLGPRKNQYPLSPVNRTAPSSIALYGPAAARPMVMVLASAPPSTPQLLCGRRPGARDDGSPSTAQRLRGRWRGARGDGFGRPRSRRPSGCAVDGRAREMMVRHLRPSAMAGARDDGSLSPAQRLLGRWRGARVMVVARTPLSTAGRRRGASGDGSCEGPAVDVRSTAGWRGLPSSLLNHKHKTAGLPLKRSSLVLLKQTLVSKNQLSSTFRGKGSRDGKIDGGEGR